MHTAIAAALAFAAAVTTASALVPVEVCVTSRIAREANSQHARFAVEYYAASEAPLLSLTTRYIGRFVPGASRTTANDLAKSFIINGTTCDVVIGTGSSLLSPVLSPIVDQLWIDYSATSSRLTDPSLFPFFNRVNPSTVQGTAAIAALAARFGWTKVNTLAYNDEIGVTTIAGFVQNLVDLGGEPGLSLSVDPTSSKADFIRMMDAFAASDSRVVFFSSTLEQPPFVWLMEINPAAHPRYRHLTFMFAQASCGNPAHPWAEIPGSFCVDYGVNTTRLQPFRTAYLARDVSVDQRALSVIGWPQLTAEDATSTGTFAVYAADATRYALRVYNAYVAQNNGSKMPRGSEALPQFVRDFGTMEDGFSGRVDLDGNGDRENSQMVILNARPGNGTAIIADASGTDLTMPDGTEVYYVGVGRGTSENPIDWRRVPPTDEPVLSTGAIAGIACGGTFVIVFVVALVLVNRERNDAAFAPTDEGKPFTIVFTDIQASTLLWARAPALMGPAVDQHHEIIRGLIVRHGGYEVKTIGDAFMVAFKDVEPAARFALDIQTAFVASEWGTEDFDEVYKDIDAGIREELGETQAAGSVRGLHGTRFVRQAEETPSEYRERWNGLRVRVGLNTGLGTIKLDPTTHRFDYYGTVVNAAARIESLATGGQVLVSDESYKALKRACGDALVPADEAASVPSEKREHAVLWKPMGRHEVRGLTDGVQVVQIDPATLWTRAFPPIGKSMGGDLDTDLAEELASVADSDTELRSGGGDQQQKDVASSAERAGWPSPAAMHASDGDAVSRDDGGYSPQAPPALLTDAAILTKEATNMSFDLSSGQAAARAKTQRRTLEMLAARNGQDYSDAVVDHHTYVDTMLSALPPVKRFETMRTIAEAWRCGGDLTATTSSGAFFPSFRRTAVSPAMAEADASFLAFDVAAKIETAYKTRRLVRKGVAALGGTLGPNRRRSSIGFAAMAMMRRSSGATGVSKETESVGKVPTFVDEDGAPLREEETHAHDLAKTDRIEVVSAGDAA